MATPQRTNFFQIPQSKIPNKPSKLLSFTIQAFWFSDKDLVTCAKAHRFLASSPLGATLPDSSERKPSGIPLAAVDDRSASVSSSFPSRLSLGGPPLLRQSSL